MDTVEAYRHPAHLAEGDRPLLHQHHQVLLGAVGSEASYFGSGWAVGIAVAEPFAVGDAVDFAVVVVAVGWTVDFAVVAAVVESVDFEFPMQLRNPYDVADSLGVESVLNYSFHQSLKGFSAADHWDPACAIGAGFPSCRPRLQLPIADWL